MTRLALIAALFAVAPTFAADPELPGKEDPLVRELRDLRKEIAALRSQRVLDASINAADMKLLHARLDRMEKTLERMAERGPVSTFKKATGTGTLLLDNRLGVNAYVTVDGVSYTVSPLSTRRVELSPGTLGYSITADGRGVRPLVQTPLAAGETVTLKIF